MSYGFQVDTELAEIGQFLQSWTSILDCRLEKKESGLEIEIICFQGEKLPKLPTAAKLIVRQWDPASDTPLMHASSLKILETM
jgi:hypothetical protein